MILKENIEKEFIQVKKKKIYTKLLLKKIIITME